jgi:hypothetical protein
MPFLYSFSGRYVPDDPLDEGLTVVRVAKGYDNSARNVKGHE